MGSLCAELWTVSWQFEDDVFEEDRDRSEAVYASVWRKMSLVRNVIWMDAAAPVLGKVIHVGHLIIGPCR